MELSSLTIVEQILGKDALSENKIWQKISSAYTASLNLELTKANLHYHSLWESELLPNIFLKKLGLLRICQLYQA